MKKCLFFLCGLAMPFLFCCAQRPLRTGDTLPSLPCAHIENGKVRQAPLTILDFWATWCKTCIVQFPKLDSLQHQFHDSLQILLVNNIRLSAEKPLALPDFISAYMKQHPAFSLPFVITNSDTLYQYFPAVYLPHYVWHDGRRKILAITNSDAVTEANIHRALRGEPIVSPTTPVYE